MPHVVFIDIGLNFKISLGHIAKDIADIFNNRLLIAD